MRPGIVKSEVRQRAMKILLHSRLKMAWVSGTRRIKTLCLCSKNWKMEKKQKGGGNAKKYMIH